jgi:uncharacterized protein
MKDNSYIAGKHIFIRHPNFQLKDVEVKNDDYYKKKRKFLEETNLLSGNKILFRDIHKKEIEKSIENIQQVVLEVTEKCNLNCVYCTYGELYSGNEERLKEKHHLKKETAIKLLEHLYPIWKEREQTGLVQQIMIGFYGGEPLLNFTLIEEIVQWIKERTTPQLSFRFHITTNGLLLNRYIAFLVKNDFTTSISLDGDEENMSYRIDHKGKNCFEQVYKNIIAVKKEYPDFFEKNVFFIAVLHNKNSVEQACSFCMTCFNKIPLCSSLNDSGIGSQKNALFLEMKETIPIKLSKKTQKEILRKGIGLTGVINFIRFYSGFHFYGYNELLSKEEDNEKKKIPTGVCFPFSKKIYMTINGNLYPCERLDNCFSLGNIHIPNVLNAEQIVYLYNQYFQNILPTCTTCERKFSCNKCLFCIDNIQENKPQCNSIMNQEEFNNMVKSIVTEFKKNPELYRIIMKRLIF